MASHPGKRTLICAVREFLDSELKPALADRALQYKLRVAQNVLAIVEREIELQQASECAQASALQQLLGSHSNSIEDMTQQLCQGIRRGQFDGEEVALLDYLEHTALDQLAIDNPRYSTFQQLTGEATPLLL